MCYRQARAVSSGRRCRKGNSRRREMLGLMETTLIIGSVLWVIGSVLVGLWGQRKGTSFWKGFLISILLSVLVGAIVVALEKDKVTGRRGLKTWT